jgi:hypothetical protein
MLESEVGFTIIVTLLMEILDNLDLTTGFVKIEICIIILCSEVTILLEKQFLVLQRKHSKKMQQPATKNRFR